MRKRILVFTKILYILCSMLIVYGMFFSEHTNVMADTSPMVTVDSKQGNPGEQITVNVSITPGSTMVAGSFKLQYDPTKLEVVSAKAGQIIQKSNAIVNKTFSSDSIKVSWAGTSPINGEGALCMVTFNIKADATVGFTNLTILDLKLGNINEVLIPAIVTNGGVNICALSSEFTVTNLQITDDSGYGISRLPASGFINATATITQKVSSNNHPVLVIVLYDANNRIKSVKYNQVQLSQGQTQDVSTSLPLEGDVSGYHAKVMVWDGLITMHPIFRVSELH